MYPVCIPTTIAELSFDLPEDQRKGVRDESIAAWRGDILKSLRGVKPSFDVCTAADLVTEHQVLSWFWTNTGSGSLLGHLLLDVVTAHHQLLQSSQDTTTSTLPNDLAAALRTRLAHPTISTPYVSSTRIEYCERYHLHGKGKTCSRSRVMSTKFDDKYFNAAKDRLVYKAVHERAIALTDDSEESETESFVDVTSFADFLKSRNTVRRREGTPVVVKGHGVEQLSSADGDTQMTTANDAEQRMGEEE
jgi:hypothetical protein